MKNLIARTGIVCIKRHDCIIGMSTWQEMSARQDKTAWCVFLSAWQQSRDAVHVCLSGNVRMIWLVFMIQPACTSCLSTWQDVASWQDFSARQDMFSWPDISAHRANMLEMTFLHGSLNDKSCLHDSAFLHGGHWLVRGQVWPVSTSRCKSSPALSAVLSPPPSSAQPGTIPRAQWGPISASLAATSFSLSTHMARPPPPPPLPPPHIPSYSLCTKTNNPNKVHRVGFRRSLWKNWAPRDPAS